MHLGCRGSFPIGKGAKIAKAMPEIRKLIAKSGEIKRAFQYSWVKAALDDALICCDRLVGSGVVTFG